jgi:hypothetical protein
VSAEEPLDPAVLAAIVAAVDAAWPRPAVEVAPALPEPSQWRFSARWWARPAASRRSRPW